MIEYGLSISTDEHFDKLSVRKCAGFDFIEFSGALLDSESACRKLESVRKAGCALVVKDIVDPALVHLVQNENFQVKLEFDRKLHERCSAAGALGAEVAGAAFDVMRALEYPEYEPGLIGLLKSSIGAFYENNLDIAISGRLPGPPGSPDITRLIAFCKKISYPRLKTVIEFHIHEPGAFEELAKHFAILKFYRSFWRICYEPEHGNQLNSGLLKHFLEAADMTSAAEARIAISPGHQIPDDATLRDILKVISEVENE
ncbi:MAG: hypothetical protein J6W67_04370 [Lentisphaeria bacterium]|nr:hypothetical protein [Lentisphaeria bacterium]